MVFEIATITVKPGSQSDFEAGVKQALELFRRAKGYRSVTLQRSIEHPDKYRLVVGWETIDNHMVDFRNSPEFVAWRGLVGSFFAASPDVEHVEEVVFD